MIGSPTNARRAGLRVLLIGINYAPELTGIGPYTTGLAEHLAAQGCRVRVVTGLGHYPGWRRMPDGSVPPRANLALTRYWHFIPARPTAGGRMLYEATWLASASRALAAGRADAVIAIIPALSGGVLAWLAGRRFRAPVGLVFQDLMGMAAEQSGYQGARPVAGTVTRVEGFVARHADQVAVVSDGFRPYLERIGVRPERLMRLRNWSRVVEPTESVAAARARLGWKPSDFIGLHSGNMGQKQALDNFLETAQLIRDPGIRIVLAGEGNDRDRLMARARERSLDNVSFIGLQPAGQFEAMLRAADVLLINQRSSMSDMALPSKLASYFLSGRPVVAAVSPDSSTAREVEKAQGGLVVPAEDPPALLAAILKLRDSPETAQALGANAMTWAHHNLAPEQALAGYDVFLDRLLGRAS